MTSSRFVVGVLRHCVADSAFFPYHFQMNFIQEIYGCRLQKSLQFFPKGAIDYKSKLVQAMAWRRADTEPLPESAVIQFSGE